MSTLIKHHGFLVVFAEEGAPKQWGPRVGWDTIWSTMAEAEDCAARARDALSGLAPRVVNHDRTIAVSRGPRQIDGSLRLYGYLDSLTQQAAQRAEDQDRLVRNTGSHDARTPDVIVDVDVRRGRWEPVRGEGRLAAAIARAAIYTDEPSPETGDVGWCWWADGSMGCAPTYEDACRAAEAAIYRRIANRMAVM